MLIISEESKLGKCMNLRLSWLTRSSNLPGKQAKSRVCGDSVLYWNLHGGAERPAWCWHVK